MIGRRITVISAAIATLASSAVGATVLRGPDAKATDVADAVQSAQEQLKNLPEIALEVGEQPASGVGESLVLVVAAQVPQPDAERTLEEINAPFGELKGFSVDASDNYELTGVFAQVSSDSIVVACAAAELDCPDGVSTVNELQPVKLQYVDRNTLPEAGLSTAPVGTEFSLVPGNSLVLTGFRTKRGAEEFIEFARAVGVRSLVTVQARKVGGTDIGLGQEPHPDGSGPLLGPLPDQKQYQQ